MQCHKEAYRWTDCWLDVIDGEFCHVQTVPDHIEKRIDGLIKDVPIQGIGKAVQGFSWEGDRVRG